MATPTDPVAIARDIAQESCLRIPMTGPERISQRRCVFVAADTVRKMCEISNGEEDVANLILYGALIVEYAADFLAKNPHTEMSELRCVLTDLNLTTLPLYRRFLTILLRVLKLMEKMKDILNYRTQDGDDDDNESLGLKSELIDALANVRLSRPTKSAP